MIKQLLVTLITYEFELDHAIPNLYGYIIVVVILTVLSGPSSGAQLSTTSYAYVNLPHLIIPP